MDEEFFSGKMIAVITAVTVALFAAVYFGVVYFMAEPPSISNVRVVEMISNPPITTRIGNEKLAQYTRRRKREREEVKDRTFLTLEYDRKDAPGASNNDSVRWYLNKKLQSGLNDKTYIPKFKSGNFTQEVYCVVTGSNGYTSSKPLKSAVFIIPPERVMTTAEAMIEQMEMNTTHSFHNSKGFFRYISGDLYKMQGSEYVLWTGEYSENGSRYKKVEGKVFAFDEEYEEWRECGKDGKPVPRVTSLQKHMASNPPDAEKPPLTLSGTIRDIQTGQPISEAAVSLRDYRGVTDQNGYYKISVRNIPARTKGGRFLVEHPDHYPYEVQHFDMAETDETYDAAMLSNSVDLSLYDETYRDNGPAFKWGSQPKFVIHAEVFGKEFKVERVFGREKTLFTDPAPLFGPEAAKNTGPKPFMISAGDIDFIKKTLVSAIPIATDGLWRVNYSDIESGDFSDLIDIYKNPFTGAPASGPDYARWKSYEDNMGKMNGHIIVCRDIELPTDRLGQASVGRREFSLISLKYISASTIKHEFIHSYFQAGGAHTGKHSIMADNRPGTQRSSDFTDLDREAFKIHRLMPAGARPPMKLDRKQ